MTKLFKNASLSVPILTCAVFLLLAFSNYFINEETVGDNNAFLVIIIVQVIVFVIPAILYCRLRSEKFRQPMLLAGVKPTHILFVFFSALMLVCGNLLLKYLFYSGGATGAESIGYLDKLFTAAGADSGAGIFFAYCFAPAVCEELLFRGVILSEYRRYGSLNAVVITALYFALLHFSSAGFIMYLYAGVILGIVTVVCRSVFPAMILHMLNNTISLYGNDLFLRLTVQRSGVFFMGFVLFSVFLLSLIFVLSRIEQVYYGYAEKPPEASLVPKSRNNLLIYISPAIIAPVVVFLAIRLFF